MIEKVFNEMFLLLFEHFTLYERLIGTLNTLKEVWKTNISVLRVEGVCIMLVVYNVCRLLKDKW